MPGRAWHRRMIRLKLSKLPPIDIAENVNAATAEYGLKIIANIIKEHKEHLLPEEQYVLKRLKLIFERKLS